MNTIGNTIETLKGFNVNTYTIEDATFAINEMLNNMGRDDVIATRIDVRNDERFKSLTFNVSAWTNSDGKIVKHQVVKTDTHSFHTRQESFRVVKRVVKSAPKK
jgi:hypothetical protein